MTFLFIFLIKISPYSYVAFFLLSDLLGEGAFSQVYRGTYQGSMVAIKRLKVPLSAQDKNYFTAEVPPDLMAHYIIINPSLQLGH